MGPNGLRRAATLSQQRALNAAQVLGSLPGHRLRFSSTPFFREFVLQTPRAIPSHTIEKHMLEHNILGPYMLSKTYPDLSDGLLFCFTEMNEPGDVEDVAKAIATL